MRCRKPPAGCRRERQHFVKAAEHRGLQVIERRVVPDYGGPSTGNVYLDRANLTNRDSSANLSSLLGCERAGKRLASRQVDRSVGRWRDGLARSLGSHIYRPFVTMNPVRQEILVGLTRVRRALLGVHHVLESAVRTGPALPPSASNWMPISVGSPAVRGQSGRSIIRPSSRARMGSPAMPKP